MDGIEPDLQLGSNGISIQNQIWILSLIIIIILGGGHYHEIDLSYYLYFQLPLDRLIFPIRGQLTTNGDEVTLKSRFPVIPADNDYIELPPLIGPVTGDSNSSQVELEQFRAADQVTKNN